MLEPHEDHLATVTSSVGTPTSRSAGVYPCARRTGHGVSGHRPTPAGAAAEGRAARLAAARQCSPHDEQTAAAAHAQGPQAGRATGAPRPEPGVGAAGGGG